MFQGFSFIRAEDESPVHPRDHEEQGPSKLGLSQKGLADSGTLY